MSRKIIWPEGALKAWKTDDKDFMKSRREEWRLVKKNLNEFLGTSRKAHKFHKELFMTGDIKDPNFDTGSTLLCSNAGPLIFQMWYYPVNDKKVFRQLFESSTPGEINGARQGLIQNLEMPPIKEHPDYGLLAGREDVIFRVLYPFYDSNEQLEIRPGFGLLPLGPTFQGVVDILNTAYNSLFYGGVISFFHPGRNLWDYLEFYLNDRPFSEYAIREATASFFYNVIRLIRYQSEKSTNFAADKPDVVTVAQKLKDQFENDEFSNNLTAIYNDIDRLYDQYCAHDRYFKAKNG